MHGVLLFFLPNIDNVPPVSSIAYSISSIVLYPLSLNCKSKSAYLMDYNSKTVIYSKNETLRLPIASMCKVMTLLLCFDAISNNIISENDLVCVSEHASGMGGSQVFLEENGEYLVSELLKSIVVASANEACVAMAEKLCGSEEIFVIKMTSRS